MVRQEESDITTFSLRRDHTVDAHNEHDALAEAICARLRDGSLPPDEAYWWTRILVEGAIDRLSNLSPRLAHPCHDCGCSRRKAQAA